MTPEEREVFAWLAQASETLIRISHMTPKEYTLLDRIVSKLEWVQDEAAYPEVYNSNEWIFDALYTITSSLNNGYSCWFRGKPVGKGITKFEEAKDACRTHQLEQVRKIFGDEGMAELREMHKAKQILDELRPVK